MLADVHNLVLIVIFALLILWIAGIIRRMIILFFTVGKSGLWRRHYPLTSSPGVGGGGDCRLSSFANSTPPSAMGQSSSARRQSLRSRFFVFPIEVLLQIPFSELVGSDDAARAVEQSEQQRSPSSVAGGSSGGPMDVEDDEDGTEILRRTRCLVLPFQVDTHAISAAPNSRNAGHDGLNRTSSRLTNSRSGGSAVALADPSTAAVPQASPVAGGGNLLISSSGTMVAADDVVLRSPMTVSSLTFSTTAEGGGGRGASAGAGAGATAVEGSNQDTMQRGGCVSSGLQVYRCAHRSANDDDDEEGNEDDAAGNPCDSLGDTTSNNNSNNVFVRDESNSAGGAGLLRRRHPTAADQQEEPSSTASRRQKTPKPFSFRSPTVVAIPTVGSCASRCYASLPVPLKEIRWGTLLDGFESSSSSSSSSSLTFTASLMIASTDAMQQFLRNATTEVTLLRKMKRKKAKEQQSAQQAALSVGNERGDGEAGAMHLGGTAGSGVGGGDAIDDDDRALSGRLIPRAQDCAARRRMVALENCQLIGHTASWKKGSDKKDEGEGYSHTVNPNECCRCCPSRRPRAPTATPPSMVRSETMPFTPRGLPPLALTPTKDAGAAGSSSPSVAVPPSCEGSTGRTQSSPNKNSFLPTIHFSHREWRKLVQLESARTNKAMQGHPNDPQEKALFLIVECAVDTRPGGSVDPMTTAALPSKKPMHRANLGKEASAERDDLELQEVPPSSSLMSDNKARSIPWTLVYRAELDVNNHSGEALTLQLINSSSTFAALEPTSTTINSTMALAGGGGGGGSGAHHRYVIPSVFSQTTPQLRDGSSHHSGSTTAAVGGSVAAPISSFPSTPQRSTPTSPGATFGERSPPASHVTDHHPPPESSFEADFADGAGQDVAHMGHHDPEEGMTSGAVDVPALLSPDQHAPGPLTVSWSMESDRRSHPASFSVPDDVDVPEVSGPTTTTVLPAAQIGESPPFPSTASVSSTPPSSTVSLRPALLPRGGGVDPHPSTASVRGLQITNNALSQRSPPPPLSAIAHRRTRSIEKLPRAFFHDPSAGGFGDTPLASTVVSPAFVAHHSNNASSPPPLATASLQLLWCRRGGLIFALEPVYDAAVLADEDDPLTTMTSASGTDDDASQSGTLASSTDETGGENAPAPDIAPVDLQPALVPPPPPSLSMGRCVVCFTTVRSVLLLLPCKHYGVCTVCARRLERCPVCRTVIQEEIRVEIS